MKAPRCDNCRPIDDNAKLGPKSKAPQMLLASKRTTADLVTRRWKCPVCQQVATTTEEPSKES